MAGEESCLVETAAPAMEAAAEGMAAEAGVATETLTVVEDLEGAAKGAGEELSQCTCRRLYSRP